MANSNIHKSTINSKCSCNRNKKTNVKDMKGHHCVHGDGSAFCEHEQVGLVITQAHSPTPPETVSVKKTKKTHRVIEQVIVIPIVQIIVAVKVKTISQCPLILLLTLPITDGQMVKPN
uniref:Band 3 anion transport protein n=1 Tax=Lygus hesperus TaxID=30085 RepID=A0A0A9Z2A3_LYGHE